MSKIVIIAVGVLLLFPCLVIAQEGRALSDVECLETEWDDPVDVRKTYDRNMPFIQPACPDTDLATDPEFSKEEDEFFSTLTAWEEALKTAKTEEISLAKRAAWEQFSRVSAVMVQKCDTYDILPCLLQSSE